MKDEMSIISMAKAQNTGINGKMPFSGNAEPPDVLLLF